jgi:hypothetical protein
LLHSVVAIGAFLFSPLDIVGLLGGRVLFHEASDHLFGVGELVEVVLEDFGFLELLHEGASFG